jgi:hypothetical protein
MYRVTYSEAISETYRRKNMLEIQEPNKRRIYRWGTLWGMLEGNKWICERRVVLKQSEDCVIESCTPVSCDILPKDMDDLWEEEYIPLSKGIEFTGLVSIMGNAKFVLEGAGNQGLPLPELPTFSELPTQPPNLHKVPNQHKPKFPTKSHTDRKCLIRD